MRDIVDVCLPKIPENTARNKKNNNIIILQKKLRGYVIMLLTT